MLLSNPNLFRNHSNLRKLEPLTNLNINKKNFQFQEHL